MTNLELDDVSIPRDDNAQRPVWMRVAIAGLLTCIAIYVIDIAVLQVARHNEWTGGSIYLVFAIFIVQTACLGTFVGLKVARQPVWWLFFAWTLILVNLILLLVIFNADPWTQRNQKAFVYAFLTAQIGLAIFWGTLATTDWRRRVPISSALLIVCCYPYIIPGSSWRTWMSVMTCYIVSVAAACAILRVSKFRLGSKESWIAKAKSGRIDQFGIKHLFIWTTIVAVLFGVGRFVPWAAIANSILNERMLAMVGRAVLMTMIIVSTAWTVLGSLRGAWWRVLVLLVVLVAVGGGLVYIELSGTRSKLSGWRLNADDLWSIWLTWTTLNGLFLAGLMLVLRCSGWQLARIGKSDLAE